MLKRKIDHDCSAKRTPKQSRAFNMKVVQELSEIITPISWPLNWI
jgi:hypothetical protein